jgi:hypothetical protein
MQHRMLVQACLTGIALMVSGCASASGGGGAESGSRSISLSPTKVGNALVLSGEQIWQRSSDLLSLLANRVSAMQVRRYGHCPTITMRGIKTYVGSPDPFIYVNGAQAGNTCILEMMRSEDVERIEVYPMGVTHRPGYAPSPNGLILIFLRDAHSQLADGDGEVEL